jgi:hypothetical protein
MVKLSEPSGALKRGSEDMNTEAAKRALILVGVMALLAGWALNVLGTESTMPRDCHYMFAHTAIPTLVFTKTEALLTAFETRGQAFIEDLWASVAEVAEKHGQPPIDKTGLRFSKENRDNINIYLIELPRPGAITEAYFVGVAQKDKTVKYFTLELAAKMMNDRCDTSTVLGGWTTDHKHQNYGCGPKPQREEFIKAICENFDLSP